jgi:hypothetical protein
MQQQITIEDLCKKHPEYAHLYRNMPPITRKPKAKPVVASVPVSEKLAEAAKANPESVKVRVTAKGSDGVVVVDPPRSAAIVDEAEQRVRVAAQQRSEARVERERIDQEAKRYRPPGKVMHVYNPLDRLGE